MKRSELVKSLELVSNALAQDDLVPLFTCFAFDGKTVSAYSDTIGIIAPCEGITPCAVNGKTLLGLLQNSYAEDVEFAIESKQELAVKTGKSRFKLPYFTKDDFVFIRPAFAKDAEGVTLDGQNIAGLISCLLTSSRDLAQPKLLGVCLRNYKDKVALYSCDGDTLTRFVADQETIGSNCLMPNLFCEVVIKLFKEMKVEAGELLVNDQWAYARFDNGYHVYGRLIEAIDPIDYEELIAKNKKGKVDMVAVPKGLDHALSRARVVADAESAKTVLEVGEGLRLTTETHMGLIKDVLPYKGTVQVKANVSAAKVQLAIGLCDEMAILEGCTMYRNGKYLLMIISNMG